VSKQRVLKKKGRRRRFSGHWGEWENLTEMAREQLAKGDDRVPRGLLACWRNRVFGVQLTRDDYEGHPCVRLTVNRHDKTDGISWEDLQRIRTDLLPNSWCVELYPPEQHVVRSCHMRHLWIIDEPPFGWKNTEQPNENAEETGEEDSGRGDADEAVHAPGVRTRTEAAREGAKVPG